MVMGTPACAATGTMLAVALPKLVDETIAENK